MKKVWTIWLPTAQAWSSFVAQYGAAGSPAADDIRASNHSAAVAAAVDLLAQEQEGWLLLSTPDVARLARPHADLATQEGRAAVAVTLARQCDLTLGLSVAAGAVGSSLIRQGHARWKRTLVETRDRVKIFEVTCPPPTTPPAAPAGAGDER